MMSMEKNMDMIVFREPCAHLRNARREGQHLEISSQIALVHHL